MDQGLVDHYRCPGKFLAFEISKTLSDIPGFFRFGSDLTCYGRVAFGAQRPSLTDQLVDVSDHLRTDGQCLVLPFDPTEVVNNLRYERYVPSTARDRSRLKALYYSIRPALPAPVRRRIQRMYFRGWRHIAFPQWPVDFTVERVFEKTLVHVMRASGIDALPFIWFWPDGAESAVVMTHDVETASGRDFCRQLMDIDDFFAIPSSFQLVPEGRYSTSGALLDEFRARNHEIVVHDFNHDGSLFDDRAEFLKRLTAIQSYSQEVGARGFRSAMLYRNAGWLGNLKSDYDMSVPNIGHLEIQRGGCCTVFPYFIEEVLELPVTVTQDYSLFHILQTYSMDIWRSQIELIARHHGLINIITHPDYLQGVREQELYRCLLTTLKQYGANRGTWITAPWAVNHWWRQRSKMMLVEGLDGWQIVGPGHERAQVGLINIKDGNVVYTH